MCTDHRLRVDIGPDCAPSLSNDIATAIFEIASARGYYLYTHKDNTSQQTVFEIVAHDRKRMLEASIERDALKLLRDVAQSNGMTIDSLLRQLAESEG